MVTFRSYVSLPEGSSMIFLETSVEFGGLPIASWLLEAIPDAESGPTLYKGLDISCIEQLPNWWRISMDI